MSSPTGPVQAAAVAARSADHLRKLASRVTELQAENAELTAKVASYERSERVHKIASAMEEKGLNIELTFEEKVASLTTYSDLERVEEAVKMASSGSLHLASVTDDDETVRGRVSGGLNSFAQFCVTGDSGN
jgi:hypothetical protein